MRAPVPFSAASTSLANVIVLLGAVVLDGRWPILERNSKPGRRWSSVQTVPRRATARYSNALQSLGLFAAWNGSVPGVQRRGSAIPSGDGAPRRVLEGSTCRDTRTHRTHPGQFERPGMGQKERAVEVASCLGELRLLVARSPTCSDQRPVDVYFPTTVRLSREMSSNSTIGVLPTSGLATASPGRAEVEGAISLPWYVG